MDRSTGIENRNKEPIKSHMFLFPQRPMIVNEAVETISRKNICTLMRARETSPFHPRRNHSDETRRSIATAYAIWCVLLAFLSFAKETR